MMKLKTGTFVDPETFETLADNETLDAHGTDLVGDDEHGCWWGTARAAWVLETIEDEPGPARPTTCRSVQVVVGWCWAGHYDGYFVGTVEEARPYAVCHGVRVESIETMFRA